MSQLRISIQPYKTELAPHFARINLEWIEEMFVVEEMDRQMLLNPQQHVIEKGGKIWFAVHEDLGVLGTCAIINKGEGAYELTKMGVSAASRGLKVGESLLQHVIRQSIDMGVDRLYLLTNKKCEAAIHLYEKNDFEHCPSVMKEFGNCYDRCDVAMEYRKS